MLRNLKQRVVAWECCRSRAEKLQDICVLSSKKGFIKYCLQQLGLLKLLVALTSLRSTSENRSWKGGYHQHYTFWPRFKDNTVTSGDLRWFRGSLSPRFGYRAHPVYTFGECETHLSCRWSLERRKLSGLWDLKRLSRYQLVTSLENISSLFLHFFDFIPYTDPQPESIDVDCQLFWFGARRSSSMQELTFSPNGWGTIPSQVSDLCARSLQLDTLDEGLARSKTWKTDWFRSPFFSDGKTTLDLFVRVNLWHAWELSAFERWRKLNKLVCRWNYLHTSALPSIWSSFFDVFLRSFGLTLWWQ